MVLNRIFVKMDNLDKERVQYMISAENYAGCLPSNGMYVWSLMLDKSGRTVTYWKIRLSPMQSIMSPLLDYKLLRTISGSHILGVTIKDI